MISEQEWQKLKGDETYGMYSELASKIQYMNVRLDQIESRMDVLGRR